ncbi:1-aminocyclopropane-1-carboxylate deaminase/D-cysteine desulfhydrase [Embleya hyalina]|uniref:1-aminocyclopropane-1-carboxylate deaminase n=1 Tax=Embleya hyalina TaxID=516124 RepID=A0A401YVG6_9ACTN|nr:pyridoxal-phosphate dependent enzyme [Embleya hyalina]GCD98535.1 1-aminocyclopropane-1-carboxylate deaminase [Embleya hyalina]
MKTPLLHERFPTHDPDWPFFRHLPLGERPTPVGRLSGLADGAAEVWIKDESGFGDLWGGNKVRKLEWVIAAALGRRSPTILTFGALGTNHGLATARFARAHGIHVALALVDQPLDEHVLLRSEQLEASGATIHRTRTKARTHLLAPWLILRHGRFVGGRFRPAYVLPTGGSSPVGMLGYVECGLEIAAQVDAGELPEPSHVVLPVGSGGTAAGLALGLRLAGLRTRVTGIVVNDRLPLDARRIAEMANRTARLLRRRTGDIRVTDLRPEDVTTTRDWLGAGYGHPTPEAERIIRDSRTIGGPELEPVYTAKALAALRDMNARGDLGDGAVLYLHTHGPR